MFQVRIHGRGGQGVVTTSELLALACFVEGRHAQAFPSFGSERTGAPVASFVRIDDHPVRSHEPVVAPDAVLVQDPTLLRAGGVLAGLEPDGWLLVNTRADVPAEVIETVGPGVRVRTVNASDTALRLVGRDAPGPALLGALAAATGVVSLEALLVAVRDRFAGAVAEANVEAVVDTYQCVVGAEPSGGRRAPTM
ncbi:MAG TPA: 2-oxoacid:acceptor oxidoreductase family protein [Actinomycetes bacterium]